MSWLGIFGFFSFFVVFLAAQEWHKKKYSKLYGPTLPPPAVPQVQSYDYEGLRIQIQEEILRRQAFRLSPSDENQGQVKSESVKETPAPEPVKTRFELLD